MWNEIKREAYIKGRPVCECCRMRYAAEAHHWLVRRDKRYKRLVDKSINMSNVCHRCHQDGHVDGYEFRERKMRELVRQGRGDEIAEYLENLADAGKIVKEQLILLERVRNE